jgi:hypothetical protein
MFCTDHFFRLLFTSQEFLQYLFAHMYISRPEKLQEIAFRFRSFVFYTHMLTLTYELINTLKNIEPRVQPMALLAIFAVGIRERIFPIQVIQDGVGHQGPGRLYRQQLIYYTLGTHVA